MRLMLAFSLIIVASLPNYAQSVAISPVPKMPGRLVEADAGNRLHLWCIGEGTPTVILVRGTWILLDRLGACPTGARREQSCLFV